MKQLFLSFCAVFVLGSVAAAAGHDHKGGMMAHPEMTNEQRDQMAIVHEQMAVCLRSEKTMSVCHEEMKASCKEKAGADGCPMMGGMMMNGPMKESKAKEPKSGK